MKKRISKREKLINFIDKIVFYCRKINLMKYKKYVKRNKCFKNSHLGESCYIFGNGPSLKGIDFSKFANKFVFTVNQLPRNPNFVNLKSNIHFWADPQFFNLDSSKKEDKEIMDIMEKINDNEKETMCFYPAEFHNYVEKNNLYNEKSFYFLNSFSLPSFLRRKNTFDSFIPAFYTVVQYAIFLANYMGFSKIYIFGCEMTSIITVIKTRLGTLEDSNYGYDMPENEKNRMKELRKGIPCSEEFYNLYKALSDYDYLEYYCEKHGSKIYNCTPDSIIDSIEKCSLEEALTN